MPGLVSRNSHSGSMIYACIGVSPIVTRKFEQCRRRTQFPRVGTILRIPELATVSELLRCLTEKRENLEWGPNQDESSQGCVITGGEP